MGKDIGIWVLEESSKKPQKVGVLLHKLNDILDANALWFGVVFFFFFSPSLKVWFV